MLTIILNTFREALAKKIFIGYYIFYGIVVLLMFFLVNTDSAEGIAALGDKKNIVINVEAFFQTAAFSLILFFSLISASSFIPSMVEKGNIDLLLSKPISRFNILISKFLGAVAFAGSSMVFLMGSIWLILSLKSGYWSINFLSSILSLTVAFGVMFSIALLFGLLTQSSIVSILVNFFLIFVLCPVLSHREAWIFTFVKNSGVQFVFNFFYYIFPKPGEIGDLSTLLTAGEPINSGLTAVSPENSLLLGNWMSLITSVLFCAVILGYSAYYFSKKDY
jgi:ABC-type transport system involved in multi-copper enzyme maturation permease subunit